jgi:hypothetical protein
VTHVSYPDFTVWSPGRTRRLEVRDPANAARAANPYVSYAYKFVYALYEGDADEPLWTRKHRGDGSPCTGWVSDAGWVVVATRSAISAGLVVLSPTGERKRALQVDPSAFTRTTAGPGWGGTGTRGAITSREGRPHFVLEEPQLELDLDS